MHGMDLRYFQFRFALGTSKDLAFLDLFFVDVDFRGTFGATDHGTILRRASSKVRCGTPALPPSVLYTSPQQVKRRAGHCCNEYSGATGRYENAIFARISRTPLGGSGWRC